MKTSVNLLLIFSQLAVSLNAQLCEKPIDIPAGQSTVLNVTQERSDEEECYWNLTTAANFKLNVTCIANDPTKPCKPLMVTTDGPTRSTSLCLPFTVHGKNVTIKQENKDQEGINTVDFFCKITSSNEKDCECGRIPAHLSNNNQPRIVGGVEAEINEFPSMAALYQDNEYICGAVIISPSLLLTNEHWVQKTAQYKVLVGAHFINETDDGEFYEIFDIIRQEEDEIVLLITEKLITFSDKIGAACLPFNIKKEDLIGRFVTAAGWGSNKGKSACHSIMINSEKLMKVDLEIVEDNICMIPESSDASKHLCAYTPEKSTCWYDEGGPLYYIKNNRYYLVGIISGHQLLGEPSLNMNLNYFLNWIKESVEGEEFCEI